MQYPQVHVMRYMGNKGKLLEFIIPRLEELISPGDTVLDLMSGTCSISYALKPHYRVFANDIQSYAHVVAMALIENPGRQISRERATAELGKHIHASEQDAHCRFFQSHYTDTYFSYRQCRDIDTIRCAINQVPDIYRRSLYLTALIFAMCYAQSTTGHFAQYLPKEHPRLAALRRINLREAFYSKCGDLEVIPSPRDNRAFRLEATACLSTVRQEKVSLVYLDPPYSAAQYSRFYHLLETAVLYDRPRLKFKGLYRHSRSRSDFCYGNRAAAAFESVISRTRQELGASLAISYSDSGLLPLEQLVTLCRRYYRHVDVVVHSHPHSSQGKGKKSVKEFLVRCF